MGPELGPDGVKHPYSSRHQGCGLSSIRECVLHVNLVLIHGKSRAA
jgi:hypothetical protein